MTPPDNTETAWNPTDTEAEEERHEPGTCECEDCREADAEWAETERDYWRMVS